MNQKSSGLSAISPLFWQPLSPAPPHTKKERLAGARALPKKSFVAANLEASTNGFEWQHLLQSPFLWFRGQAKLALYFGSRSDLLTSFADLLPPNMFECSNLRPSYIYRERKLIASASTTAATCRTSRHLPRGDRRPQRPPPLVGSSTDVHLAATRHTQASPGARIRLSGADPKP